jgi:hypothetical protein
MKQVPTTRTILRSISVLLTAASLAACSTNGPQTAAPSPAATVLYKARPNVSHIDPPGPHTPLKPEPPKTLAETALHPVARGLAITGRTALVPIAVGGGFMAGRPDASMAMIDAVLTEPLP